MITVMVSGVGAVIGYGIVQSLRAGAERVRIVGIDLDGDAVGKQWCDVFVPCPRLDAPDYQEFLKKIVGEYEIQLMIPGLPQEVDFLDEIAAREMLGTEIVLNQSDLIRLAQDKFVLNEQLVEHGLPSIPSAVAGNFEELAERLGLPFLLKPRRGMSARGIQEIENEADFRYGAERLNGKWMAQKMVGKGADEFTAGVFGFGDGTGTPPIVFRRRLAAGGATGRAEVVEIERLNVQIERLTQLWRPLGPTNFQFRYDANEYWLHDVNARISSSSSMRTAFGFNEPDMCIEFFLKGIRPNPQVKRGKAVRYLVDWVVYEL